MKKYSIILALLLLSAFGIYRWKLNQKDTSGSESLAVKNIGEVQKAPKDGTYAEPQISEEEEPTPIRETSQDPLKESQSSLVGQQPVAKDLDTDEATADEKLYEELYRTRREGSDEQVQDALIEVAIKSSQIEKAMTTMQEFGVLGYTATSVLINRIAKDEPEFARASLRKLLAEFQNVSGTDIQTTSSICMSIGNVFNLDFSDELIEAIKVEENTRKRHCLFGGFVNYKDLPIEKQKMIIDLALNDKAKEIQQTGTMWKKYGRILTLDEMSKEYERIYKVKP